GPILAQPKLVAIRGPICGEVIALGEPETTIGRSAANRVCLADLALSRAHCAILVDRCTAVLRDLDSSNGTFVNGMQVTEQALHDGDRISVGESVFLFVSGGADLEPERVQAGTTAAPTSLLRVDAALGL